MVTVSSLITVTNLPRKDSQVKERTEDRSLAAQMQTI
jgi:hypothetical protein